MLPENVDVVKTKAVYIVMERNQERLQLVLGALGIKGKYPMKGDIGTFLVCGNRTYPMNEEILIVHRYLMKEWKINESVGKHGPKGDKGDRGPSGTQRPVGPKVARGLPGFLMIAWMPNFVLNGYRKVKNPFVFI